MTTNILIQNEKINSLLEQVSPKKVNYFANSALVLSVSGFIFGFTFIFGIILGHIALYRINRLEKETTGAKQAAWALLLGYFGLGCIVLFFGSIMFGIIQLYVEAFFS